MALSHQLFSSVALMAIASVVVSPSANATTVITTSSDPLIVQPSATPVVAEVLYTSGDDNVRVKLPNGDYRMLTLTKAEQRRLGVRPGGDLLLVTEGDRVLYVADADTPVEVATVEIAQVERSLEVETERFELEQETIIETPRPIEPTPPAVRRPISPQPVIPARPSAPEAIRGLW
ncbi:MAG: hypothetical protein HC881_14885 [Leptolyngbyaceae cyanobacterium SL_7_1]|nr:hypothetical protein [Leptolyngbyaceae cyanobacterium SL_7_1]